MNVYNWLLKHEDIAHIGYTIGVIPPHIKRNVEFYREYAKLKTWHPGWSNSKCIQRVIDAQQLKITLQHGYRIVKQMETVITKKWL